MNRRRILCNLSRSPGGRILAALYLSTMRTETERIAR